MEFLARCWWLVLARGVLGIVLAVLAFALPLATLTALVLLFGAFALVDGVLMLFAAASGRPGECRWPVLPHGGLGVALGMLVLAAPFATAVTVLLVIAAWAVLTGVFQVHRRHSAAARPRGPVAARAGRCAVDRVRGAAGGLPQRGAGGAGVAVRGVLADQRDCAHLAGQPPAPRTRADDQLCPLIARDFRALRTCGSATCGLDPRPANAFESARTAAREKSRRAAKLATQAMHPTCIPP